MHQMLPLLIAAIIFAFLAVGAVVFVLCALIPPLRKYSLSAALWCAVWGPCSVAWLILAGLAVVANGFAMQSTRLGHLSLPATPHQLWTGYGVFALICMASLATIAAVVHQWLVHRMTLALFRIYAGLVSAGIGSVFGWTFGFWLATVPEFPFKFVFWILAMLALCGIFGWAALRNARWLRGDAPQSFAWVSPEEFSQTSPEASQ